MTGDAPILMRDDEDEATADVPLDDEESSEDAGFPEYDDNSPNLALDWMGHDQGKEELKEIADLVCANFEEAFESTEEYRDRATRDWNLFVGDLPAKTFPFKDAANCHVPIALENTTRNTFRAYSELFGDWNNVFGVSPLGPGDEEQADLLTLHGNWQLRQQIPDFKRQMMRAMLAFFFIGDVTVHSYWDEQLQQNRHVVLTPDEFIVPYAVTSTMPDYSDVPFRVKIVYWYRHQLQAMKGIWHGVEDVLDEKPAWDDEPEQKMGDSVARIQGIEKTEGKEGSAAPYKLLWYEGWLELPNQDKDRFCRVVVDKKTRAVMDLVIHEHENWQDRARFDSQAAEKEQYKASLSAYQQAQEAQQAQIAQAATQAVYAQEMGMLPPEHAQHVGSELQQATEQLQMSQPPPAPVWMKDPDDPTEEPEAPRREPINLFTHIVCIEPLVGNLGLGYGRIQADYNRAGNTALSQFIDSATYNNVPFFITTTAVEFEGGKLNVSPGAINKVTGLTGEELKASIMQMQMGPPAPALLETVDKVYQYGQSSMQSPSVLSGEPGKSGETARGIAARIEQATKQLSVTTRKFADEGLVQILRNNALINSIYMKDEELFHVALAKGEVPKEMKIGRQLYERNYHVEIRADLRFAAQSQRVMEADEMLAMPKMVPALMGNLSFMWHAAKRALLARDRGDMIPFLGPEPMLPVNPLGAGPQMWLKPEDQQAAQAAQPPPPPPQPPKPSPPPIPVAVVNGGPPQGGGPPGVRPGPM